MLTETKYNTTEIKEKRCQINRNINSETSLIFKKKWQNMTSLPESGLNPCRRWQHRLQSEKNWCAPSDAGAPPQTGEEKQLKVCYKVKTL